MIRFAPPSEVPGYVLTVSSNGIVRLSPVEASNVVKHWLITCRFVQRLSTGIMLDPTIGFSSQTSAAARMRSCSVAFVSPFLVQPYKDGEIQNERKKA